MVANKPRFELTESMSLASSKSKAIVSPAAILMLTSSLSSSRCSLGRCLRNKPASISAPELPTPTPPVRFLRFQDAFELTGRADGEQQGPGQQGVDVQLAHLRTDGRTGSVHPGVGPGEQALEALHGRLHVLKQKRGQKTFRTWECILL